MQFFVGGLHFQTVTICHGFMIRILRALFELSAISLGIPAFRQPYRHIS
jgi:hypothetical protein